MKFDTYTYYISVPTMQNLLTECFRTHLPEDHINRVFLFMVFDFLIHFEPFNSHNLIPKITINTHKIDKIIQTTQT